ncbi:MULTISPECIES: ABC transporter permease [Marinomonas]|uniref:ABC transporter permease n=1 Tax=Marinomonas arctica TaxID=383750 RepID=A0A7H1JBC7_9GAMM|nr:MULTISPECIES: ABC transporter permease [Marinomonas]MCS7485499.1 ABC transporter permease [Marinomonas sp. BSi20414]QNT07793.1 ABC transporter permease [Marinomonas arctica]GGN25569.1 ABC transporter permease [Marinomonas arctica]
MKFTMTGSQWVGLGVLLSLLIFAVLGMMFSPFSISQQDLNAVLDSPSAVHWLGTDHFGRSMLTRMAHAVGLSFALGVLCVVTSSLLGTALGVWAVWGGKKVDHILGVMVNILLALPGLVVVLLFAAIVPGSFWILYLAISLVQWVEYFRVVRAITQNVIHSPARQSSQMMGFGHWYQFKRHIWPAIVPSVFTLAAFGGANAILTMASLGFVYVGIQPPLAELGLMTVELFPFYSDAPWLLAQPLVVIALMVFGFHLLAGKRV